MHTLRITKLAIWLALASILAIGSAFADTVHVEVWRDNPSSGLPIILNVGDIIEFHSDHPQTPFIPCPFTAATAWDVRVAAGPFGGEWESPPIPLSIHTWYSPVIINWVMPVDFWALYYTPPYTPGQFCPYLRGCIRIIDPGGVCCEGMRGDVYLDCGGSSVDVSDLTLLVAYMFRGGDPPICPLEADIDGSGSNDIADVTALVGYMFKGGPEPAACP